MLRCSAFLIALLVSGVAQAADVTEGETLVRKGRFADAIVELKQLVSPPKVKGKDLRRAREALAQAYFHTHQTDEARAELTLLLRVFPTAKPDENRLPPDFFAFYAKEREAILAKRADKKTKQPVEHVKAAEPPVVEQAKPAAESAKPLAEQTKPVTDQTKPSVEQPKPVATTPEIAPPSKTPDTTIIVAPIVEPVIITRPKPAYVPAPWYLKILPFGIGQFCNHDYAGGAVWLVAELLLIGANVGISVFNENQFNAGYPRSSLFPAMYIAQIASGVVAYLVAGLGILDAFLWSPGRAERAQVSASIVPFQDGRGGQGAAMLITSPLSY